MAIQVNYGPSALAVGEVAAAAAAQDEQQQQEQIAFQQEMARAQLEEERRRANMASRQQDQSLAVQYALQQQQMQQRGQMQAADNMLRQQQMQQQQGQFQEQLGFQGEQKNLDRQSRYGEMMYQAEQEKLKQRAQFGAAQWENFEKTKNQYSAEQQAEWINQWKQDFGTAIGNPVSIETAEKEHQSPEIKMANARKFVQSFDGYRPDMEFLVQMDQNGNVDYSAFHKQIELEQKHVQVQSDVVLKEQERRYKNIEAREKQFLALVGATDKYGNSLVPQEEILPTLKKFNEERSRLVGDAPADDEAKQLEQAAVSAEAQQKAENMGVEYVQDDDDLDAFMTEMKRTRPPGTTVQWIGPDGVLQEATL